MLQNLNQHVFPWMRACLTGIVSMILLPAAWSGTFGKVVPIGGHASDIALDEARGVLYVANYTAGRIDVMPLADNVIRESMNVAPFPGSLALSPDGRFLVIGHFGNFDASQHENALTVINLADGSRKTYGLGQPPLGVAFGIDGVALVLTTTDFLLFDPVSGSTQVLDSVAGVTAKTLPVPPATFPPQIISASVAASGDGLHIYGFTDTIRFTYNVTTRRVTSRGYSSVPALGPRVISVSYDGSQYAAGWGLFSCRQGLTGECEDGSPLLAQFPGASGNLSVGSLAIQSSKATLYAQLPPAGDAPVAPGSQTLCFPDGRCVTVTDNSAPAAGAALPPSLLVMDADNLTVRERLQLPENLGGRSVFNSGETTLYAISDSGVTVLPVGSAQSARRVIAVQEDVVFRGNFCQRGAMTQPLDIVDPGGGNTAFQICADSAASATGCPSILGVTISPASGVTPARVQVSVDPNAFQDRMGTTALRYQVLSATAVNLPPPPVRGAAETLAPNVRDRFRILINNREPDYRGTFFNVPGTLVDLLADPARDRFYILRQDTNQVLIFDSNSYNQIATLRTSNTPTQLAFTFDRRYLLVGHDNSQLAYVFDLDTFEPQLPIQFPAGHYPRSIAASGNAILAASRVAGEAHTIDRIDFPGRTAFPLPSLGAYTNSIHMGTVLTPSPNGSSILATMPDGNLMLYDASADRFTVSRKDFKTLKGAYAASSYGLFAVDNHLLNESLVAVASMDLGDDSSSGFAFVDQLAFRTRAPARDPKTAAAGAAGYIERMDFGASTHALPTRTAEAPLVGDTDFVFTRTLAPLYNRSAIVSLTTSGFTVLPWNYDASVPAPRLERIVNAADLSQPVAPGGLISVYGQQLSLVNVATREIPLPTALGEACLTVNGVMVPMLLASPSQINGQLPFNVDGRAAMVLRTPGGVSDTLNFMISPAAPGVFRNGTAGSETGIATVVREKTNDLVTVSNPVHSSDKLIIYLTGLGRTWPPVEAGTPAPADPLSVAVIEPAVTLGGASLAVEFAGLAPGEIGIYQINATVPPRGIPLGFDVPLVISQSGSSTSVLVRVVQ